MNYFYVIFILCQINVLFVPRANCASNESETETLSILKPPTVVIATLFRNKAHTLPLFLSYLERLDYPKDRISLWFRADHNEDNTLEILKVWLKRTKNSYHEVNFEYDDKTERFESEASRLYWPDERYFHVINLREQALNYARRLWADYIFMVDADVFLVRPLALRELISFEVPIVAPMLLSDGLYSNFWGAMRPDYYYQRTSQYKKIYSYDERGLFDVPMIHSAVLINLNDIRSDDLTFNKTILANRITLNQHEVDRIPVDDTIIFALSANFSRIPMKISNDALYGFVMVPLEADDEFTKDYHQLTNLKIMILNEEGVDAIDVEKDLEQFVVYPEADSLTLDRIFMINLARRPERRQQMERSFKELGLTVEYFEAVDGQIIDDDYLEENGIEHLPGYADPYHNRPMTLGEIGCFLSHYQIWEKQVALGLKEILILEDDIRFEPYFKDRAVDLLNEARRIGGWDLIYFGRKRMVKKAEKWVGNSEQLTHASYSYWTLGYVLSLEGAKKLLAARPLENLIPVDEFLPIMFNQHLNETWKNAFPNRSLVAWSADPLLIFPTHYVGDQGYVSDTEESDIIKVSEDDTKQKKGNKEIFNRRTDKDSANTESNESASETSTNGSIDTSFVINNVNDHPAIHQHSEL